MPRFATGIHLRDGPFASASTTNRRWPAALQQGMTPAVLWPWLTQVAAAEPPAVQVVDTDVPIAIDGRLDEPAWDSAAPVTDFIRYIPTDGGPAPGRTELRILQDQRYIYFGVRVSESDYPIRARMAVREDVSSDDQIGIYLDTFGDQRTGYIFYLNALGVQQDIRFANGSWNMAWNTLFKSKGRQTEDGYVLEVAIPFRSLKFPSGAQEQQWRMIITRKIPFYGAKYAFPTIDRAHPRLFEQGAFLQGVRTPRRGSGLELIPTVTVVQTEDSDGWSGIDPWHEAIRPGASARLGVTPNVGLAVAANPDFSQVEGDTTQVDLNQRYAFFYSERRPFFLDGVNYFQDQASTLYSRSVVDPIYGVKVSGREQGAMLGVIHALDQSPAATVNENGTPGFDSEDVEDALASTTYGRLALDAFGTGYVGFSIADKGIFGPEGLRGTNDVLGIDTQIPIGPRWTVKAGNMQSLTKSDEDDLWGQWSTLSAGTPSGKGTAGGMYAYDSTSGFRKETGFQTRSGITTVGGWADHTLEPAGVVDTITPGIEASVRDERNGDRGAQVEASGSATIGGIHRVSVSGSWNPLREDGVTLWSAWSASGSYNAELGRVLAVSLNGSTGRTLDFTTLRGADSGSGSLNLTMRPTTNLRFDTYTQFQLLSTTEGDFSATVLRAKGNWQFSRALGVRLIGEWATQDRYGLNQLQAAALVSWVLNPGTAAYVGYTQVSQLEGDTERGIFAKVSGLVRL